MIELTPEQWRTVAGAEEATAIEPESKAEYVVVRKDVIDKLRATVDHDTSPAAILDAVVSKIPIELTEAEKAMALRVVWMRRMGLDENEITESLRDEPPTSVEQEMRELAALERLKNKPSSDILRKLATKY